MATGWREQKKALLRNKIYETAMALFREQGYEETTVNQITQRAKVAKGTFFNHFPSKEHLLTMWYNICDKQAYEYCEDQEYASAKEAITALVRMNVLIVLKDKELLIAKNKVVAHQPVMANEEQEQDSQFFNYCQRFLERDKAGGILKPQLDTAYFSNLIITLTTGNARRWIYQAGDFDLADSVERDLAFIFKIVEKEH